MKKLLSAVTSAVMGLSLMTSAFASSFTVSAAGRTSVAQPNVSLGTEADVSAKINAAEDFVAKAGEATVDLNDASYDGYVDFDVYLEAVTGHTVSMVTVYMGDLPAGIVVDEEYPFEKNFQAVGSKVCDYLNGGVYINCLKGGEPVAVDSSKPLITYSFKLPDDITPGDYPMSLLRSQP